MSVSRKALADATVARAQALGGLTVFKGEVVDPPLIQTGGVPDPSGRIAPYVVLYFGAGSPDAGYEDDCLNAIDRVHAQFFRWAPTVAGLIVGRLRPPLGFDPGTVRRDDDVNPPRFYLPLLFTLTATN